MNESNGTAVADEHRGNPGRFPRLRNGALARSVAASAILLIWAASTLFDIYSATYDPPDGINTVALAAATYLFGSAFFRDKRGGDA